MTDVPINKEEQTNIERVVSSAVNGCEEARKAFKFFGAPNLAPCVIGAHLRAGLEIIDIFNEANHRASNSISNSIPEKPKNPRPDGNKSR